MRGQDQQTRVLYELCALAFSILRSPPLPVQYTAASQPLPASPMSSISAVPRRTQVSPAGLASMLLGASLALTLCGSVTFVIGFMLMPWVLGLVMMFAFIGIMSNLSGLGRSILCPTRASASRSSCKEMPGRLFSKLPIL